MPVLMVLLSCNSKNNSETKNNENLSSKDTTLNKSKIKEIGTISSYYLQEADKFIFVDKLVLYTSGQNVIGFYGWSAQNSSEFYLIGKRKGNEINGLQYSLFDNSSTEFKLKILSKSIVGLSHLEQEVPVDTTDLFAREDDFESEYDIYEMPNKKSKKIHSQFQLVNNGFKLIEIGKMEKNGDEYNIWYKVKSKDFEGWVFGLIRTI